MSALSARSLRLWRAVIYPLMMMAASGGIAEKSAEWGQNSSMLFPLFAPKTSSHQSVIKYRFTFSEIVLSALQPGSYGSLRMAKYPRLTISTTETKTAKTTALKTLIALLGLRTFQRIAPIDRTI
jgi:hypothetical protein